MCFNKLLVIIFFLLNKQGSEYICAQDHDTF